MINPLSIATGGYLTPAGATQTVLTLALAGYLAFGSAPPPSFFPGGDDTYIKRQERPAHIQRRLKKEDDEILAIMAVILKWR